MRLSEERRIRLEKSRRRGARRAREQATLAASLANIVVPYTDGFDELDPSWSVVSYAGGGVASIQDGKLRLTNPNNGDFWGVADGGTVAARPLGAMAFEVDVAALAGSNIRTAMFRAGMVANAAFAGLVHVAAVGGMAIVWRNAAGGNADYSGYSGVTPAPPFRVRLELAENLKTVTIKLWDGAEWDTLFAHTTVDALALPCLVSGGGGTTVDFDNYAEG